MDAISIIGEAALQVPPTFSSSVPKWWIKVLLEALSSNPNPLQCPSYHVESMKSSKSSHHGAVRIVLVWRADQQGALHTCLQGPAGREADDADSELM